MYKLQEVLGKQLSCGCYCQFAPTRLSEPWDSSLEQALWMITNDLLLTYALILLDCTTLVPCAILMVPIALDLQSAQLVPRNTATKSLLSTGKDEGANHTHDHTAAPHGQAESSVALSLNESSRSCTE